MRDRRITIIWKKNVEKNRVLVLYGPRKTGKTTLLSSHLAGSKKRYLLENIRFADLISSRDLTMIQDFAKGYEIIAIDEAQMIPDIGDRTIIKTPGRSCT